MQLTQGYQLFDAQFGNKGGQSQLGVANQHRLVPHSPPPFADGPHTAGSRIVLDIYHKILPSSISLSMYDEETEIRLFWGQTLGHSSGVEAVIFCRAVNCHCGISENN
jgi:hypothetical protein